MNKIVGILLAAGSSRRFGSNKLLTPINNEAMVISAAKKLLNVTDSLTIVVRPGDIKLCDLLVSVDATIIENPNANQGMGTSLAIGIQANANADGWLIGLADMPWIQPHTYTQIANAVRQGASIVAPAYNGQLGHPVGFAAQWFSSLSSLRGDRGAQKILKQNSSDLQQIACNDSGVIRDIDTLQDMDYSLTKPE